MPKVMKLQCLYASSSNSADVLYLAGLQVPDPFLSLVFGRHKIAIVNQLEYGRVQRDSKYTKVFELEALKQTILEAEPELKSKFKLAHFIDYFFKLYRADSIVIPKSFPAFLLIQLQALDLPISVIESSFFPLREKKNAEELNYIRQANRACAHGFKLVHAVLKASKIRFGRLYYEGAVLTSERMRRMIELCLIEKGAVAQSTIVAGGLQACDPHQIGQGPLRANELIIVDIFPRLVESGYHGDMTRTFLKGQASPAQRGLVQIVRKAQKAAVAKIKAGISADSIHKSVCECFDQAGYHTLKRADSSVFEGFIHSTGHGLGLDIHEAPRVGASKNRLRCHQVITIEPGLYYPELGACRIEDVYAVTQKGSDKLSLYNYRWEIT